MPTETRLDRLEREIRIHRVLLLVLVLAAVGWMGWQEWGRGPEVLRVSALEVVNRQGQPVFFLGETTEGHGVMQLRNASGLPILSTVPGPGGHGVLKVNNANGELRVQLVGMNRAGSGGGLTIQNNSGEFVGGVYPSSEGHGLLPLCHATETRCETYGFGFTGLGRRM